MIARSRAKAHSSSMGHQRENKFVALVDDDDLVRTAIQGLLKSVGLPARAYASGEEFLDSGQQHQTACLIADIRMPGMSGLDLQARLNAQRCLIPTIFITAHGDEAMRLQAMRAGAVEFLPKPFDDELLIESVRAALER
jgi:FixJ family two-component response regulator